jgi:hypothetical protein
MTEFTAISRPRFEAEVLPVYAPAVLRGVVTDWPLVAAGRDGLEGALRYLAGFDVGAAVDALLARPDALRAFGYAPGLDGFNFLRDRRPLAALFEQFWRCCRAWRRSTSIRCSPRPWRRGCGWATAAPRRRTSTARTTWPASWRGGVASRSCGPRALQTSTSARPTMRRPRRR